MKMLKKIKKDVIAVSPVIAALMLVLVAVGAATAFFAWEQSWQDETQENMGDADMDGRETITIAGSSTVYPFSVLAAEQFMEDYPQYKVDVSKGGSGAGVTAAQTGVADIGAASSDKSSSAPDLTHITIGKDAVALVTADDSHGLVSMNQTVANDIWQTNGGDSTYTLQCLYDADGDGSISWDEVYAEAGDDTTNCTGTEEIVLYDRAEDSGTEECFCKTILDDGGQLDEAGITADQGYTSNQDLSSAILDDVNCLSFMSFGIAAEKGLNMIAFTAEEGGTPLVPSTDNVQDGTYDGCRPLNYMINGEPSYAVELFLNFVKTPQVNQELMSEAGYVSIY